MSICFLSISLYMMITTKYTHALGDYVLEFIGLKSWTNNYSGLHLTILYFVPLTIIALCLVQKYAINKCGVRKRNVIFLLIVFLTLFSSLTNITAKNIKKNSQGLLSIGFNSKNSNFSCLSNENAYTDFNAQIEITNFSNKRKEFHLALKNPFNDQKPSSYLNIFAKEGYKADFDINGNETKLFIIKPDNYKITWYKQLSNCSSDGVLEEILLTTHQGKSIKLGKNNFFGIDINR